MAVMRLDRFLCEMGTGTRSEVKNYIKKARVMVNDNVCKSPEYKINTDTDVICFDNLPVTYVEYEYYMLNKPQGVLSATEDKNAATVIDLIDSRVRKDLFPVGRLDKDTEGLLLITNDGMLAHNLLSPKKHVDKVYYARVDGDVKDEYVQLFKEGVRLDDGMLAMPADLKILSNENNKSEILLTIHEGKFHQVKRMMEAVGCSVTYLKRLSMGSLKLDKALMPGQYRSLTEEELNDIRK